MKLMSVPNNHHTKGLGKEFMDLGIMVEYITFGNSNGKLNSFKKLEI